MMFLTTPARATHLTDACGMPVADLRLVEQHPGQTLWADGGQPIASYGIFLLGYRRGTAWIVVPKRPTRHPVALGRHVGQFLAQTVRNYALRRVDVQVSPCDPQAVRLALKGNPTILLPFFTPESACRVLTDVGRQLRALAPLIVSTQCFEPFRGYMRQQHERLLGVRGQRRVTRPELVERYGYDVKYAAHIIRLGLQGQELLATGYISLPMRLYDRELVRDIRGGCFSLAEVHAHISEAEQALIRGLATSPLRHEPDWGQVEAWMIQTYMETWTAMRCHR